MSAVKHTPGPWTVEIPKAWPGRRQDTYVRADGWGVIAACGIDYSLPHCVEQQKANARLIAAAPELLEACRNARDMLATDRQGYIDGQCLRDARTEDPIAHGLVAVGDGVWLDSDDAEALRDYDRAIELIDVAIAKATGSQA